MQEELPLVVYGATRVDPAVSNGRLERRTLPQIQRLGGLHIIMTVGKHCGRVAARPTPLPDNYRMSSSLVDGRLKSGVAHVSRDPFRSARGIRVMLGASAHTRYPKQLE